MTVKKRSEAKYTTPDEARAAVQRLRDELDAAKVDAEKSRTAVETIMATIGGRVLDARAAGDNAAEVAAQGELTAARTEAEVAAKIVDTLGKRIEDAERDVLRADAHALRVKASSIMDEARPRLEKTRKLLDALQVAEDVRVLPEPYVHASGVFAVGSWKRTRTGQVLVEILEYEQQASNLEVRAGIAPAPSILSGVADVAWHVGNAGTVEAGVPIKVGGSQLDDAARALRGDRTEPPTGFDALKRELAQKVMHRG